MSYLSRDDIQIRITIKPTDKYLCQATVIFFGVIEKNGWGVMKSTKMHERFGEYLWVQGPRIPWGKKAYKEIVYINDKRTWELIHEMIYDAYAMKRSNEDSHEVTQGTERDELTKSEEVNPDDIPF